MSTTLEPVEFHLSEWRRPLAALGWWNLVQLSIVVGCFGLLAVGALATLSCPPKIAVPVGAGLAVAVLTVILFFDLRKHPAGKLKLQDGRIQFSAWAGRRWDVAVQDVLVVSHQTGHEPVLAIILKGAPRIFIHQTRVAVSLEEIQATLFAQLGVPKDAEQRKATTRETLVIYGRMLRSRWTVLLLLAAFCALMEWFIHR